MIVMNYLRKVRSFNKSRFSRNRQTARVIFYFAIYINILIIFGIFSVIYQITFKLSNLWWLVFFFFLSFILPSLKRMNVFNKC